MTRITEAEAIKLWIPLKPVKKIKIPNFNGGIRENKYWAKKTDVDNITFHSKKEAERYKDLKLLEKAWRISDLILQPRFLLQEAFIYNKKAVPWISYIADFQYTQDSQTIVEDVKGCKTNIYKIKRKLFLKKFWYYKFIET